MTSLPHAGNHRPPLRTASSGISRPPAQALSQSFNPPPRSVPQHVLADRNAATTPHNASEPPSKRQKLDPGYVSTVSPIQLQQGYERPPSPPRQTAHPPTTISIKPIPATSSSSTTIISQVPSFPIRPKDLARSKGGVCPVLSKATSRESVQARPYQLEVPKTAPQYGGKSPADFFPWAGHHPEDILNEQSTKNGHYDKVISQNETNTARPSVWSGLKHKSGLQILSSLFVSVLDQRQAHGTVTAKCTFKPPPRVTLTDAKREAWLRDLANSTIPLRRLSRTIPHGIRGKSLLDHCLAKRIPTWRAVWLAKCVGANEIRAFKRKGTSGAFSVGGESKWIKDWTSNVEQFVEALVTSCNSPGWRSNIIYGLQLVTHIESEHLLDPEHFFDWIIAALSCCDQEMLPAWLLVIESHLNETKRFRFRCRRLIEALLEQLAKISTPETKGTSASLQPSIVALYQAVLKLCFDEEDPRLDHFFQHIPERNLRLCRPSCADVVGSYQTPRQRLITLLDALGSDFDIIALSFSANEIVDDPDVLISTLIEWATTCYRAGASRIYIALRLLRQWSKAGWSLDQPVLRFLSHFSNTPGLDRPSMYKLFAELIRAKLLAAGKYLQWLIARGPHVDDSEAKSAEVFELQLLDNIPLHGLPTHVLNLRQILMKAGGLLVSKPRETEESIRSIITAQLGFLRTKGLPLEPSFKFSSLAFLSGSTKYGISRWIRQKIACKFRDGDNDELESAEEKPQTTFMTLKDFQAVREILETFGDYLILADVLDIISVSCQKPLLEAVAETANDHIDIFQALGAAEDLFHKIFARMEVVYTRGPTDKTILMSLLDLGESVPNVDPTLRVLQRELQLCQPKAAAAACSPVSDHMVEVLQSSDATFIEDTEALFSSGTSMDEQIATQVFSEVTKRLQLVLQNEGEVQYFIDLLAQLRPFDTERFDALMLGWLGELVWSADDFRSLQIIIPLVCTRLVNLGRLLQSVVLHLREAENHDAYAGIAMQIMNLLMTEKTDGWLLNTQRMYRFYRGRDALVREYPSVITSIIQYSQWASHHKDSAIRQSAKRLTSNPRYLQLIRAVLLRHKPAVQELGQSLALNSLREQADQLLCSLLGLGSRDGLSPSMIDGAIRHVLHSTDDFNLGVCQLELFILLTQYHDSSSDSDTSNEHVIDVLVHEAASSFHSRPGIWARLISILPRGYAEMFRNGCILAISGAMQDWSLDQRGNCEGLLASIDVAESKTSSDGSFGIIIEILKLIVSVRTAPPLAKLQIDLGLDEGLDGSREAQQEQQHCHTCMWIDILLRLLTIHYNTIAHPKFPQQMLCRLLLSLSLLLVNPNLIAHHTLSTRLFDLIAFFSDHVAPDSRIFCATILRDQHSLRDSRLQYLFGVADSEEGESLHITSTTRISTLVSVDPGNRVPLPLRRWEMVQDATPIIGENDTSLSLNLFGTRKGVL
ncbi:RNA polymerase II mediator complex subunit [Trapelia coarctata]|nr:RNA polymerase II mediator complex subunit [Trapelia coarctata]